MFLHLFLRQGHKDRMASPFLQLNCVVARHRAELPALQHVSLDFVKPNFVLIIKSKA